MDTDLGKLMDSIVKNPDFVRLVGELNGGEVPDLSEKIPQALETVGPLLNSLSSGKTTGEKAEEAPQVLKNDSRKEPETVVTGRKPWNRTNAERLLLALKPYLGGNRREIVDKCMSVMQMSDLIGTSGLLGLSAGRHES